MKEIDLRLLRLVNNVRDGMTDQQDYVYLLEVLESTIDISEGEIEQATLRHYEEIISG